MNLKLVQLFIVLEGISFCIAPKCAGLAQFKLSWPTPNPAFVSGQGFHAFLQKTGPDKDFSSGAFGCVRNNGYKFHEGIDLYPIKREKNGNPSDSIFSAMAGTVAYINHKSSESSYGKYLVLEHPDHSPSLYSLYAHLDNLRDDLRVGSKVDVAEVLGKMGHSSSFRIPQSRAHLHFEIGFRLSQEFDTWYNRKSFKTPNKHGNYNGFNLVGINPLPFFKYYQSGKMHTPNDFIKQLPEIVKLRVSSNTPPGILRINPSLCASDVIDKGTRSWICSFGPYGIPLSFTPSIEQHSDKLEIISFNKMHQTGNCRKLVEKKGNSLIPSEQLLSYLEILFVQ